MIIQEKKYALKNLKIIKLKYLNDFNELKILSKFHNF